jgi:TetR/AcrR family transcriptional repressor of nem operon
MDVHIGHMARPSKKDQILEKGMAAVRRKGLVGSSVRDITRAAEVPLGSFSNHFASKEDFGLAVIDRYFDGIRDIIGATLADTSRPPLERLRAYFDVITDRLEARGWRDGCLIGNTSLDSTEGSEAIRAHLAGSSPSGTSRSRAVSPRRRVPGRSPSRCRPPSSRTS